MKPRPEPPAADRQGRLLLVFMVVAGYVITFALRSAQDEPELTLQAVLLGIALGVAYLFLGLYPRVILDRLPAGWAEALFFCVQCSLLLGIGFVLGTNGSWLIGLPLAVFAVEMLAPRQRWLVYGALIA